MLVFTANKLKKARTKAKFSQVEATKLYKMDVRELLLESYGDVETEQMLYAIDIICY